MAGPDPDSFQRALAKFKVFLTRTSPELVDQFSMTGPQDVKRVCKEIQDQQSRNGSLRRMRRMEGFIEAMDQLGKSIEVFVNANEFVCFVWGPVKFLLGVAKQYLDSFDKLLDVYAKVGEAMPGLMLYQSTFEKHRPLATVLEDYYSDILRFHEAALRVFMRPKWKTAFQSVWKTFDTQFKPIMDSLKRRRELIESEKGSAALHEISKSREEIAAFNEELKKKGNLERFERHKERLAQVKEKLQAPDYHLDQEMATEDRNGSTSGTWVLRNSAFRKWFDMRTREHGILFVNGIPGAGKTTLVSFIVERLLEEIRIEGSDCHTLVVYFYFKHNQSHKRTHNSFLRATMEQIMTADSTLADHLSDDLASISGVNLRSTKTLESFTTTSIEHFRRCFIVMDGLDEAAPGEADKLLKWLLPFARGTVQDNGTSIRLLFSGQRDGILDHQLSAHPSIALESIVDHDVDIATYCAKIGARIRSKFSISSEMESRIVSQVTSEAKGMFLYARVVLGNLLSQTRLSRLRQEMEPGTFPDGIERAYERVAVRIFQESPPAEREDATKILGWLICAERLLHWREIQAVFCIDPESSTIDYHGDRLRLSCKQLCGSLVDINHAQNGQDGPDDVLKIVHRTAREYFLRERFLDLSLEHAKAATFCFRYLTSKPFLPGADDYQVLLYARQGYYAFQEYSVQYCLDHFLHHVGQNPSSTTQMMVKVKESAKDFLNSYDISMNTKSLHCELSSERIIQLINGLPKNPRDRFECFDIAHRTVTIRRQIEVARSHALTAEELEITNNLYGLQNIFKCPKLWCNSFTTGFRTRSDCMKHVECHERPFCCSEEDCFASKLGFDTEQKLSQHNSKYHSLSSAEVKFPKKWSNVRPGDMDKAISKGDVATVLAILDSGVDPNHPVRLLDSAVMCGQFEICKHLLARGAEIFHRIRGYEFESAMDLAIRHGSLDIMHLFLCQTELNTRQGLQHLLMRWITRVGGGIISNVEILKVLLRSPVFGRINVGQMNNSECKKLLRTAVYGPFPESLQCLLEYGFSDFVTPDILFQAEVWGRDDMVALLRPIIDTTHPPYSLQRMESLLGYLKVQSWNLSQEQRAILKNLSPDDQWKEAKKYVKGRSFLDTVLN